MKAIYIYIVLLSCGFYTSYAQTGINTLTPKVTLEVVPTNANGATPEGIIAPRLTRAQLAAKDGQYTVDQKSAIVYVTSVDGAITTKTSKVTKVGYFYFDGNVWLPFNEGMPFTEPWYIQGTTNKATTVGDNIYQTGSVAVGSSTTNGYKFQVTGDSNVTLASRAGTSTVTSNETVGGTLGVTGATTMASTLDVTGATALKSTLDVTGATALKSTLDVTGTSSLMGNVGVNSAPNSGYKLYSHGHLSITGNKYVDGFLGAFTTPGPLRVNTFGSFGSDRLGINVKNPTVPLHIVSDTPGALRIEDGNQGFGKVLTSDSYGNATWKNEGFSNASSIDGLEGKPTSILISSAVNYRYYTGYSFELPQRGTYLVSFSFIISNNAESLVANTGLIFSFSNKAADYSDKTKHPAGATEVYGQIGDGTSTRFYMNNMLTTTSDNQTVYVLMYYRPGVAIPAGATLSIKGGETGAQTSGASYVRIM